MSKTPDVTSSCQQWFYSDKVKDHFFNPRNIVKNGEAIDHDGVAEVGSVACGDVMKMWIKVKENAIVNCKFQTFGCASAIASTSIFTEMVKGKKIEEALKITAKDIAEELGGLPNRKFHCSILAHEAFKKAVENYRK